MKKQTNSTHLKKLGKEEFSKHFLRPKDGYKDARRFSIVTRAAVAATELVKDYQKMSAQLKVGFQLAKSSLIVRETKKKLRGLSTPRFDFTPKLELDNDEQDYMM